MVGGGYGVQGKVFHVKVMIVNTIFISVGKCPLSACVPNKQGTKHIRRIRNNIDHGITRSVTGIRLQPAFINLISSANVNLSIVRGLGGRGIGAHFVRHIPSNVNA